MSRITQVVLRCVIGGSALWGPNDRTTNIRWFANHSEPLRTTPF